MPGWSSLRKVVLGVGQPLRNITASGKRVAFPVLNAETSVQMRMMSDHGPRIMPLTPSRWQWHKFKDLLHFYTLLGVIPAGLVVFYANVFIGPAKLTEIPEGYVPKHWEYYSHPIQRWLARYIYPSHQQEYEKFMHNTYEEDEKAKLRRLERKIHEKMAANQDYQAYYYRPAITKYHRISKEAAEYLDSIKGN